MEKGIAVGDLVKVVCYFEYEEIDLDSSSVFVQAKIRLGNIYPNYTASDIVVYKTNNEAS